MSALRVSDEVNGLRWSNESGTDATNSVLEDKRIAGDAPVTSPDGATATVSSDFGCPG